MVYALVKWVSVYYDDFESEDDVEIVRWKYGTAH